MLPLWDYTVTRCHLHPKYCRNGWQKKKHSSWILNWSFFSHLLISCCLGSSQHQKENYCFWKVLQSYCKLGNYSPWLNKSATRLLCQETCGNCCRCGTSCFLFLGGSDFRRRGSSKRNAESDSKKSSFIKKSLWITEVSTKRITWYLGIHESNLKFPTNKNTGEGPDLNKSTSN